MNRNNILMGAYITFVFICLVVRSFTDYPAWDSLVTAIAISSAFFTYADIFYGYHESSSKNYNITKDFIIDITNMVNEDKKLLNTMKNLVDEVVTDTDDTIEIKDFVDFALESTDEIEKELTAIKSSNKARQKTIRAKKYTYIVFTYIGFLLFMCILVFEPLSKWAVENQDSISVFAFLLMMLSPILSSFLNNTVTQNKAQCDKIKGYYDECRIGISEMQKKLDRIFEVEENKNAD